MSLLGWALIQAGWCPYKERRAGHRDTGACVYSERPVRGFSEKAAICLPRREAWEVTSPVTPWSWTSSLQTLRNLMFCWVSVT